MAPSKNLFQNPIICPLNYLYSRGDNVNRPTEFWIDEENNAYQFATNLPPSYSNNARVYLNTTNVNGETRYKTGTDSSQRFTLKEAGTKVEPGGWLIFLDEELSDIYVHVGDTITLRPYDKWTWKDGTTTNAAYRWTFSDSQAPNDWNYYNNDQNERRTANWSSDNGVFTFDRHIKVDSQLDTKYWSVQGKAVKSGTYMLTSNYPDGHPITVHVLPATDESHGRTWYGGSESAAITAYPDVPGLFQVDTDGYYFYNSNNNYCAIRFNMPLTIGTADVNVVKHDKEGENSFAGS